jgi:hypothetical protein
MRAELYERLMAAQDRIAQTRYEAGVSHDAVMEALDAVDERLSEEQRREDLYLSVLAQYVQALGARRPARGAGGLR